MTAYDLRNGFVNVECGEGARFISRKQLGKYACTQRCFSSYRLHQAV